MLTLQEFKETATFGDFAATSAQLDLPETALAVCNYDGGIFAVELESGEFWTLLERDEITGTRDAIESRLYFDWYVSECVDPAEVSTTDLTTLLTAWCDWRGIEPTSADELLYLQCVNAPEERDQSTRENIVWLDWFCAVWERVQGREDSRMTGGRR